MSETSELGPATITSLSPRHAGAAGAVLARSHADYPSFRHLFPQPARRARVLVAMFTGVARDAARLGSAYVAVGSDGTVYGVALWLAPGRFPWSAWRQLRGADWMLAVLRADRRSFRAFMKTGANGARLHPVDSHWYLEAMGVDPAAQRQRLGGRLIDPVFEIADRDQVDCYLETADPENVTYYARYGFVVENDSLQVVPNGPPHIGMRRRPVAGPSGYLTKTSRVRKHLDGEDSAAPAREADPAGRRSRRLNHLGERHERSRVGVSSGGDRAM